MLLFTAKRFGALGAKGGRDEEVNVKVDGMVRVLQHRENALNKRDLIRVREVLLEWSVHEDRRVEHDEQNAHSESEHKRRASGGLSLQRVNLFDHTHITIIREVISNYTIQRKEQ